MDREREREIEREVWKRAVNLYAGEVLCRISDYVERQDGEGVLEFAERAIQDLRASMAKLEYAADIYEAMAAKE